MYVKTEVFCPKCNSTNVKIEAISRPEPKIRNLSMDELGTPREYMVTLEVRFSRYRATCKNCGYEKEYSGY